LASVFERTIGLVGITRTGLTLVAIAIEFVAFGVVVFVDGRVRFGGAVVRFDVAPVFLVAI